MPETSKRTKDGEDNAVKPDPNKKLTGDQRDRPYYYDDACGYEVYQPENEEDDEETTKEDLRRDN
jgi:hypothetical protein